MTAGKAGSAAATFFCRMRPMARTNKAKKAMAEMLRGNAKFSVARFHARMPTLIDWPPACSRRCARPACRKNEQRRFLPRATAHLRGAQRSDVRMPADPRGRRTDVS